MYKMSEKPLIRADEIRERVATLAREIVDVYDYDILLSALTGAYMFTADLNRELAKAQGAKAYNKAIAFIKASSYGNSTTSSGKLQVRGLEKIDLKGKKVLMVDDIADTAGTLCKAAEVMKEGGAKSVRAVVTHGVLSGEACSRIAESALEEVVCTDSLPIDPARCPKLHIESLPSILFQADGDGGAAEF